MMVRYFKLAVFCAVIALGIAAYLYIHNVNEPAGLGNEIKSFVITKGQGVREIAENLRKEDLIKSAFWFKVYAWKNGYKAKFLDGEYELRQNLKLKDVVLRLVDYSNANKETEIVILEGWSVADMDEYLFLKQLIGNGALKAYSDKFQKSLALQKSFELNMPYLRDDKIDSLEGYLYPDTYRVYARTTVEAIADKMLNGFKVKITPDILKEIDRRGKSLHEMIIMASIIEKEMFGYENRRKISDIFWKRIKMGMPMQSDATVNYVTKKGTDRPSLDDINVDSTYNTYKYYGLPPGPIGNPSIESIIAAVYPEKTDYLYFLTTQDGRIIFSKTHDEHVKNKQKYLK